jgi:hypothetical protein
MSYQLKIMDILIYLVSGIAFEMRLTYSCSRDVWQVTWHRRTQGVGKQVRTARQAGSSSRTSSPCLGCKSERWAPRRPRSQWRSANGWPDPECRVDWLAWRIWSPTAATRERCAPRRQLSSSVHRTHLPSQIGPPPAAMLRMEVEEGKAEVGAGVVAPTGPALIVGAPHRPVEWKEDHKRLAMPAPQRCSHTS